MSLIVLTIDDIFKITGRGYVLTCVINNPNSTIKIGDTLRNRENVTQEIQIKGIEMINYGSNFKNRRLDIIGILVEISDEEALEIKGKTLIVLN